MKRRSFLAAPIVAPPLAAAVLAPAPAAAQSMGRIVLEEHMVPARDTNIQLYVRNKRPEQGAPQRADRTVLMVHGATYPAHTSFDLQVEGMSWMDYIASRGFDVWCMDLRGYGRSTRPPEMSQPAAANPPIVRGDTAVADIAAVADFIRQRRGLERLVVLGHSWGTALMGRYAAEHAQAIERVVLYAPLWDRQTPSLVQAGSGSLGAYRTVTVQQAQARRRAGVPDGVELQPREWFEKWVEATWASDSVGAQQNPPVVRAPNGVVQDGRDFWGASPPKPFYDPSKITAPTLLVVAEWDRDTPVYMATTLLPLLTNSQGKQLTVLGQGTHGIHLERNRGALFRTVQSFLEEAQAS